jgi:hypothetical protein
LTFVKLEVDPVVALEEFWLSLERPASLVAGR